MIEYGVGASKVGNDSHSLEAKSTMKITFHMLILFFMKQNGFAFALHPTTGNQKTTEKLQLLSLREDLQLLCIIILILTFYVALMDMDKKMNTH